MFGEKFFEKKEKTSREIAEEKYQKMMERVRKAEPKDDEVDKLFNMKLSRREALGWGAIFLASATAGATNKLLKNKSEELKNSQEENKEKDENENEREVLFESNFIDQQEKEDKELREIMNLSVRKKFEITNEMIDEITTYYIRNYMKQDEECGAVRKAVENLLENKEVLDDFFLNDNFPPEIVYLAIPESGWRPEVKSRSGAIGCYQIMPYVAERIYRRKGWTKEFDDALDQKKKFLKGRYERKEFGKRFEIEEKKIKRQLRKKVEEDLKDVSINAEVSAAILEELFIAVKDNPDQMDLAMAGYNGGFFWKYLEKVKDENKRMGGKDSLQYSGFLEFLEERIEEKRKEILSGKNFTHEIREIENPDKLDGKGNPERRVETPEELAGCYKIPIETIIKLNYSKLVFDKKRKKKIFKNGTVLTIPYNDVNREIMFIKEISGFLENLRYPSKLWALLDYLKIKPTKKYAQIAEAKFAQR